MPYPWLLQAHGVPARVPAATVRATLQFEEALRSNWTAAHAANSSDRDHPGTICQAEYMSCPSMAQAAALLGDRATAGALLRRLRTNQTLPPFDVVSEYPGEGFGICAPTASALL